MDDKNASTGEVRLRPEEIISLPPHRVEYELVDFRSSSNNSSVINVTRRGLYTGTRSRTGSVSGTLVLALHVVWPEDAKSVEGKLVEALQDEDRPLSERREALQVCRAGS